MNVPRGSWQPISDFNDPNALQNGGLWMLPGGDDPNLPLEVTSLPPIAGKSVLHVSGTAGPDGAELMWHVATRVDAVLAVRFHARADLAAEELRVTIGSPRPEYWTFNRQGMNWPAKSIHLSGEWLSYEVDIHSLGFSQDHRAPEVNDLYGAIHFAMRPNEPYDLWLDEVAVEWP
jgi:hypothetical protein